MDGTCAARRISIALTCAAGAFAPIDGAAQQHAAVARQRPAVAQERTYAFADIPWGSDESAVRAAMTAKGYTFTKVDADGDLDYTGTVDGNDVVVYALMTPAPHRGLVKIFVNVLTSD